MYNFSFTFNFQKKKERCQCRQKRKDNAESREVKVRVVERTDVRVCVSTVVEAEEEDPPQRTNAEVGDLHRA